MTILFTLILVSIALTLIAMHTVVGFFATTFEKFSNRIVSEVKGKEVEETGPL